MSTHLSERPEKCPIKSCEWHRRGFARKSDKNRHTLTHFKGNLVCIFCPGSGSASQKNFNRADVFKRHLTSMHGAERTPPKSRKKVTLIPQDLTSKIATEGGKCSSCFETIHNAQEFYEHVDSCVLLHVVQDQDSSQAGDQQQSVESTRAPKKTNNVQQSTESNDSVVFGSSSVSLSDAVNKDGMINNAWNPTSSAASSLGMSRRRSVSDKAQTTDQAEWS